jgi:hypothetical protein
LIERRSISTIHLRKTRDHLQSNYASAWSYSRGWRERGEKSESTRAVPTFIFASGRAISQIMGPAPLGTLLSPILLYRPSFWSAREGRAKLVGEDDGLGPGSLTSRRMSESNREELKERIERASRGEMAAGQRRGRMK